MQMQNEHAINLVRDRLRGRYGRALDRIYVFGSVARGDARQGSDIDIMVILDDSKVQVDWLTEREIRAIVIPVELEEDVVFDMKVRGRSSLSGLPGHTEFMARVLKEGVPV